MTPIKVSTGRGYGERMPYTPVEKHKSTRERYIRVAVIDIVMSEGIKNICVSIW